MQCKELGGNLVSHNTVKNSKRSIELLSDSAWTRWYFLLFQSRVWPMASLPVTWTIASRQAAVLLDDEPCFCCSNALRPTVAYLCGTSNVLFRSIGSSRVQPFRITRFSCFIVFRLQYSFVYIPRSCCRAHGISNGTEITWIYGEINFHYILSLLPLLLFFFLCLRLFYDAVSPVQITWRHIECDRLY